MPTPYIEGLSNLRELGRGGFGVVYQAHQPAFGRDVAVKVIPGGGVDPDAIARFERECRATGSVSGHPNIVRVHDAGVTADGDPYLVMDLLSGGTLTDRVRRDGPLDLAAVLSLGVGIAGALETAHRAGIVHRDVKPDNVLFSDFGEPQLVDFGIARMQNAYESRSGSVSATIAHAAPEVIAGAEASPRSDVYSLGSVLFFALRGESPFGRSGESSLAPLINRITTAPVPDLREHRVPDAVASVVEQAMAKAPADRYATAAELGEALRAAGDAADLPTGPVPVAATRAVVLPPPPAEGECERVTDHTSARPRVPVAAVAATEPSPSVLTRGSLLAVAALVAAILLAVVAVTLIGGDDGDLVAAGSTSTTAPSTTMEVTTTSVVEETTTTVVEETTTTEATVIVVPTTQVPTTRVTTAPTTAPPPPPPTTTTLPIRAPSAVVDPRSADPIAVEEVNGVPQRVRITLSWQPPFDNGGSGPTEYRIRCTLMQQSSPYTGPGDPAPCRGGADIGSVPGNVTSFQPVVERVEPGPFTWLRWEIIPVNEGGAGPATTVTVMAPNFVGLKSWDAFPFGRVIGLSVSGGQKDCGRESSTICEQSRSAGSPLASGSNVVLFAQP